MINNLTFQHSLYYCKELQLEKFIQLYEKCTPTSPPINISPLSELDTIAAIFNQWLVVNSYTTRPIMKTSKYFSHSISYYIYSLIDNDIDAQNFLEENKHNAETLFSFAYYLTQKTLQLIKQILVEHDRKDILFKLKLRNYFIKKDLNDPSCDFLEHSYFKYSKELAQYFAQDYQNNYRFKYCIDNAIKLAK